MECDVSGPVAVQATGLAERRIRTEGSHSGNCITSHIEQTRSDNALFPKRPSQLGAGKNSDLSPR